jgi:hypothetical protein
MSQNGFLANYVFHFSLRCQTKEGWCSDLEKAYSSCSSIPWNLIGNSKDNQTTKFRNLIPIPNSLLECQLPNRAYWFSQKKKRIEPIDKLKNIVQR